MRTLELSLSFLLLTLPAAAQTAPSVKSVVYDHPAVKTTVTVHLVEGNDVPQAVTYQGPKGRYLLTWKDTTGIMVDDGENQTLYNVYSFEPRGLCFKTMHREPCSTWSFNSDSIAAGLETLIDELAKKKSKQTVGLELTSTIESLRRRARADEARRRSLEAVEALAPGSVKDPTWLRNLEDEIKAASAEVEKAAAARAAGPATPESDWLASRTLADAGSRLEVKVENVLDWMPRERH